MIIKMCNTFYLQLDYYNTILSMQMSIVAYY